MSIWKEVEAACEKFREKLVELLGDIHGVHSTVDDAKNNVLAHVPVEEEEKPTAVFENNVSTEPDTVKKSPAAETEAPKEV